MWHDVGAVAVQIGVTPSQPDELSLLRAVVGLGFLVSSVLEPDFLGCTCLWQVCCMMRTGLVAGLEVD